ncbi:hypothetical protein BH09ACT8_BH09ACT8_55410 [soil metagenome]
MTKDNRRKKAARAYQAEHDSDYTESRRATERSPGSDRRKRAAATLAVARREVCTELLRILNIPVADPQIRRLVDSMLEKADGVPLQKDAGKNQLWDVVMDGGWGTVGDVDSAHIHALAGFIRTLVDQLDDGQLATTAAGFGITEHAVSYFARTAYEITPGDDGVPRMTAAIISRRPNASAEVRAHAEQAAATVREHLRDRSGRSWADYDRKVLQQAVIEAFARLGDAYLEASESTAVRGLTWRRLSDGSMRTDVDVADDNTVSVLIKAINGDDKKSAVVDWAPEVYNEFYRTGRRRSVQTTYMCHVGIFEKGAGESDVDAAVFRELYSSGPHDQLDGQSTGTEVLGEVLADA